MKRIDKYIIKILLIVVGILFAYNLIVNPQNAMFCIGFLMAGITVLFIVSNLCLCMPFIGIGMFLYAVYDKYIGRHLEPKSSVLQYLFATIFVVVGYLTLFYLWTYTMYMCLEWRSDWIGYQLFLDKMAE